MDKQIKELAEVLLFYNIIPNDDLCDEVAEYIINAGYRRQEDVAREIFSEIEDVIREIGYFDELDFTALKKKYIGEQE